MCYPSTGSTEWLSVRSLTSLWCSFFLFRICELGTHPDHKGNPKSGKLHCHGVRYEAALFSVCWSESTLMAHTERDGLYFIRNFSAIHMSSFPSSKKPENLLPWESKSSQGSRELLAQLLRVVQQNCKRRDYWKTVEIWKTEIWRKIWEHLLWFCTGSAIHVLYKIQK